MPKAKRMTHSELDNKIIGRALRFIPMEVRDE